MIDEARFTQLEDIVTALAQEVSALREEHDSLTGGISGAIDNRKRSDYRAGFDQANPDIAKYKPAFDKMKMPELMDTASNALYDYENSDGATPEGKLQMVQDIVQELEAKFGEIMALLEKTEQAAGTPPGGEEINEPSPATGTVPSAPVAADDTQTGGESVLPNPLREAARAQRGKKL